MRRIDAILIGTLIALLLFMSGHRDGLEKPGTVNAAINQSEQPCVRAEGELVTYPEAKVVVAAETNGNIIALKVAENDRVYRGELIAELDSSEQRAQLEEAEAQVSEVNIDVHYLDSEMARSRTLEATGIISKDSAEQTERELGMAIASRELGAASVDRLKAALAKTRIYAPIDGTVIATYEAQGEMVAAGAPLVTIADLSRVRIEAEVPETDAAQVRPGMRALITADGFPRASWRGVVEEVPASLVPRRLKPEDTAHPIQARVLLVKIALNQPTPLKLNQRVDITLVGRPDDDKYWRNVQ